MKDKELRVLIADDHTLFRRLLADMLADQEAITVVGQAGGGNEAVAKARELKPDVILMDLRMPGMDGVEATRIIRSELPSTTVLMLTMSEEDSDLRDAMKAGARGYLLKNVEPYDLVRSIELVTGGHAVIYPKMTSRILGELGSAAKKEAPDPAQDSDCGLTDREKEILRSLAQGDTNKEIARSLNITETTVKAHVHSILRKLNLCNRVQAAKWAMENGAAMPSHSTPVS